MRAMKDSGVEWLGEVPAGWGLHRAKRMFKLTSDRGNSDLTILAATQKYGMWPQSRLEGVVRVKDGSDLSKFRTVHKNDFVISLRSFQGGFERSDFEGVCSPAYQTFCATKPIDYQYFKYLFKSPSFIDHMNSLTLGIREGKTIKFDDFATLILPVPPIEEQRRIADYLDEKCAQIDRAIASAEQSVEEYKAYLESTIVGQFREVKAGRVKLPYFADSVLGKMLDQSQQRGVNVHRYLANRDVQWFRINTEGLAEMDFPEGSYDRYGIEDGDILVCEGGEVGRCAVFRGDTPGIYFQKAVHRVRVDQTIAYPEFIAYQMFAKAKTGNFMEVRKGQATFSHLPGEQLKQLRFLLPPLDEQRRIADYLDEKCAQIDQAIESKQAIIEELKAYKKSLIYEVVTGKREV